MGAAMDVYVGAEDYAEGQAAPVASGASRPRNGESDSLNRKRSTSVSSVVRRTVANLKKRLSRSEVSSGSSKSDPSIPPGDFTVFCTHDTRRCTSLIHVDEVTGCLDERIAASFAHSQTGPARSRDPCASPLHRLSISADPRCTQCPLHCFGPGSGRTASPPHLTESEDSAVQLDTQTSPCGKYHYQSSEIPSGCHGSGHSCQHHDVIITCNHGNSTTTPHPLFVGGLHARRNSGGSYQHEHICEMENCPLEATDSASSVNTGLGSGSTTDFVNDGILLSDTPANFTVVPFSSHRATVTATGTEQHAQSLATQHPEHNLAPSRTTSVPFNGPCLYTAAANSETLPQRIPSSGSSGSSRINWHSVDVLRVPRSAGSTLSDDNGIPVGNSTDKRNSFSGESSPTELDERERDEDVDHFAMPVGSSPLRLGSVSADVLERRRCRSSRCCVHGCGSCTGSSAPAFASASTHSLFIAQAGSDSTRQRRYSNAAMPPSTRAPHSCRGKVGSGSQAMVAPPTAIATATVTVFGGEKSAERGGCASCCTASAGGRSGKHRPGRLWLLRRPTYEAGTSTRTTSPRRTDSFGSGDSQCEHVPACLPASASLPEEHAAAHVGASPCAVLGVPPTPPKSASYSVGSSTSCTCGATSVSRGVNLPTPNSNKQNPNTSGATNLSEMNNTLRQREIQQGRASLSSIGSNNRFIAGNSQPACCAYPKPSQSQQQQQQQHQFLSRAPKSCSYDEFSTVVGSMRRRLLSATQQGSSPSPWDQPRRLSSSSSEIRFSQKGSIGSNSSTGTRPPGQGGSAVGFGNGGRRGSRTPSWPGNAGPVFFRLASKGGKRVSMEDMEAAAELEMNFDPDADPVLGLLVNTDDLRRCDLANTMRQLNSHEASVS